MARSNETNIARLYHLHSSHVRARSVDPAHEVDLHPPRFRVYPGSLRVALPGRDFALDAPLGAVLERRRSLREYVRATMPLETLGRLLYASYGVRGSREVEGDLNYERSAPSAGARYPLEIYLATQSVEGVEDGIYHYDPRAHELELRRVGLAQPTLMDLAIGQAMVGEANVVLIITALAMRTMWKYGQRGYRYLFLDAGHLGQNVYLSATALGLCPAALGGFFDGELNALLELPSDEEAIYLICVGQPAPGSPP
ncbi:SagB/ThcOx family dehydrogenase [Nannocystis bainbridge]|uniref:SagB/ThcOx family dehydrogenase n=1 Tax=Nannocystis bainbridge TaxID=2995303 RepID=A0ABT5DV57_9BACT|nr:SagB/ThcOx family dehydrogenase [Nannocystis bainbridge]MDC0717524.1 SagB/ThcOx family dehydrogenase [Nannocystis bainbridge]